MSNTFCARSWNSYLVDLTYSKYKMCCKTPWLDMVSGEDWFNSDQIKERRYALLNSVKHSDCNSCWIEEQAGLKSFRSKLQREIFTDVYTVPNDKTVIEIKVDNICNLSCRYCGPSDSSIWAERLENKSYNKIASNQAKKNNDKEVLFEQFIAWFKTEVQNCEILIFTGGEPTISPEFYRILDTIELNNLAITINTNLNTLPAYMVKFEKALKKLAKNNTVRLRVSLDGAGAQTEWQRQGSDFKLMTENYLRLGKLPIDFVIAPTVTMLTLESLPNLAQFLVDTCGQFVKKPTINNIVGFVNYPLEFDPKEWMSSYKDEIRTFIDICQTKMLIPTFGYEQHFSKWLELPDVLPSVETVTNTLNYLNNHQAKWGGDDWKLIYPKTYRIIQDVLANGTN